MSSPLSPKKNREIVVQILYSLDLGVREGEELIELLMHEVKVSRSLLQLAYNQALAIFEAREEIDRRIGALSASYALERIGKVEKNILRLIVWDALEKTLPQEVIVAEAIRLTIKFSTESAAAFVQALVNALFESKDAALSPC